MAVTSSFEFVSRTRLLDWTQPPATSMPNKEAEESGTLDRSQGRVFCAWPPCCVFGRSGCPKRSRTAIFQFGGPEMQFFGAEGGQLAGGPQAQAK